jgi:nicotinate-nucleotide pyrophosphorylase (carboxylating)
MTAPPPLDPRHYLDLVRRAVAEDVGTGDVTTAAIVPPDLRATGVILAKRSCVVAGLAVAASAFVEVDAETHWTAHVADGDACPAGVVMALVEGRAASLLTAERTALNFLQHLSGIATLTRLLVEAAGGGLTVLDTRKTIPTLRALAKYAVRCGGGSNHRFGLFDAVLIKDNHVRVAGGIGPAVRSARAHAPGLTVEVEAQSLDEVQAAIDAGADIIMLDNLSDDAMREAVARVGGRAKVEVSGNVTLARMPALARIGADAVSIGALTHSAPAADISLEITLETGSAAR